MNNKAQATPVVIIALVIAATLVGALVYFNYKISSTGRIKAIGVAVYADEAGTIPVTSIDWGTIPPGGESIATIYCKNTGNAPITMTMSTDNWNPTTAADYITLSWDYTNQIIAPAAILKVVLTLNVSPSVFGFTDFSFDITIVGSG